MDLATLQMEYEKDKYRNQLIKEYNALVKPVIDDQTIHFWNLQLQFMEMSTRSLVQIFYALEPSLPRTKYVKRASRKCMKYNFSTVNEQHSINQDEHNCIATTLAINLSGLA